MSNNKFTPATIDRLFTIPLYQRLFEWDEVQLTQLLNDLYTSFQRDKAAPYYIGMLTTFQGIDGRYNLVDGQQRFTVLMLLGVVSSWKGFLKNEQGAIRLSFCARGNDQAYLTARINDDTSKYTNRKMEAAIGLIKSFFRRLERDEEAFKKYIFEKTTFFLSELPGDYSPQDLNRYFEAMNEAGKGLENHEILKVRLISIGEKTKEYEYTATWNLVSEMNSCLISPRQEDSEQVYRNNNFLAFIDPSFDTLARYKKISDLNSEDNERNTILSISPTSKKPQEKDKEANEQAIISFTDYLLLVLWLCLPENKRLNATDFFNKNNLLATFDAFIDQLRIAKLDSENSDFLVDVNYFFKALLNYRFLFDYYVIRQTSKDQGSITYSINHVSNNNYDVKLSLIQFQSMLLVSTEAHTWLTPFLKYLNDNKKTSVDDALTFLQDWDNIRQSNVVINLDYGSVNRYWFWRLDYYLWEKRQTYFCSDTQRKIVEKYIFRANRSIEHIEPQQPEENRMPIIGKEHIDEFGNLAMISSGQNSSLQNRSFEVKRAYVESFINGGVGGSIQSLKMLKIYEFTTWNEENLMKHHNDMIRVLIESFGDDNRYFQIIEQLEKQLFQTEPAAA
jgi:hypothetical protein